MRNKEIIKRLETLEETIIHWEPVKVYIMQEVTEPDGTVVRKLSDEDLADIKKREGKKFINIIF